jgi:hypothetical protein
MDWIRLAQDRDQWKTSEDGNEILNSAKFGGHSIEAERLVAFQGVLG